MKKKPTKKSTKKLSQKKRKTMYLKSIERLNMRATPLTHSTIQVIGQRKRKEKKTQRTF